MMRLRVARFLRLPRSPETRREAAVCSALAVLFLAALLPALGYARREYRDGLRREHLRSVKGAVERWFNDHGGYPLHPSGDISWCGSTDDPEDWFFVGILSPERTLDAGVREPWQSATPAPRYCPTLPSDVKDESGQPLAAGFFLETALENRAPEHAGFNNEHNILERTFSRDGRSVYRICGGSETQCGTSQ